LRLPLQLRNPRRKIDLLRHDASGGIATPANTPQSKKSKGQGFMKQIAEMICRRINISPTDLRGASGGQSGPDLLLSKAAQAKFPWVVEIKRQETLALPMWLRQVEGYAEKTGLKPMVIFKRNNQPVYCVLRFDDLLSYVQSYNSLSELHRK
jgi:hypothetical protein